MMCLMGSAIYHLFGTANAAWAKVLGTFDFIGITSLIVGSFVPILYYGFYEHRRYRAAYIGAMCALGSVLFVLALTPLFHDERYRKLRTALFTGLGMSGVVPITHMLFHVDSHLAHMIVIGTSATGISYLCGTLFYLTRFPEVARPGKFDLVFSSHNIWHMMVVVAALVHYAFVLKLWHETSSMLGGHARPFANGTRG
jgi:adiponectin receptor